MDHVASKAIGGRNVVILLGGPGAGKGTQAEAIMDWHKIPHISTGQLLRAELAAQSPLGLRARAALEAGGLAGDEIVDELVQQRIAREDCTNGFILDGYPRNIGQAFTLECALTAGDRQIAIDIAVDLEKMIPRLSGRRTCKTCGAIYHLVTSPPQRDGFCNCGDLLIQRSDDHEQVIRERFKAYQTATAPLTCFFDNLGIYHRVDGMRPAAGIAQDIRQLVEQKCMSVLPFTKCTAP